MKNILKYTMVFACLVFVLTSCIKDILEEDPKSILTPAFFETKQGIEGGVISAYTAFKDLNRQAGLFNTIWGTDEYTWAQQVQNNRLNSYTGIDPSDGDIEGIWNSAYPAINTCNGVIELGVNATDLSAEELASLVAEAKFLRAQWYFLLVQTYGGATLDLGSGPLAFNRNPTDQFSLNSKAEVLDVIIKDLEEAANELPDAPREEGRVWKASALHVLAKAYLTRAWSDGGQASDYQQALSTVQKLIPDATSPMANFGAMLMDDFAQVHAEDNHNNAEVLFAIQGETMNRDELNDRGGWQHFFFRPFYVRWPGMSRDVENGRPWIRFRPTDYLLNEVYNNKEVDSRYDKSFQTVWIANSESAGALKDVYRQDVFPDKFEEVKDLPPGIPVWTQEEADAGFVDPSLVGELKFNVGDTAMWLLPKHIVMTEDEKARKGFIVFNQDEYYDEVYPSLKKYDAKARPFPGTSTDPNVNSYRPVIIYRLAGTYLLGAEAALMTGNTALAADYINTLRIRAAWPGKEGENMITAGDVDIDFILDERSRELNGEFMRWFDLTRTGKLLERVQLANEQGGPNIQPFHELRPIPQSQIDLAPGFPQNPGY